jgi:hypothetical protein
MKECSISLAINKILTNSTLKFHLFTVRLAVIKKTKNSKCCKDKGTKEPPSTVDGNENEYNNCGNQYRDSTMD